MLKCKYAALQPTSLVLPALMSILYKQRLSIVSSEWAYGMLFDRYSKPIPTISAIFPEPLERLYCTAREILALLNGKDAIIPRR